MFKLQKWAKVGVLTLGLAVTSMVNAAPEHNEDIAVQMYTLRNVGTLEQQFAMAHRSGFHAVELVGTQGVSSNEMNRLLKQYQLDAMAAHIQLSDLRNDLDTVIRFNKAIDNDVIVMPWLPAEERPSSEKEWLKLGEELDQIGAKLRQNDMVLAYHNHDFEMKKYDGKLALELLAQATHADNLKLELDAAWVSRGGQNPVELVKKLSKRILSLHVKDNSGVGTHDDERNFTVVGEGIMAWDEVLPAAKQANTQWYIVEHDMPTDPEATITKANLYLTSHLNN